MSRRIARDGGHYTLEEFKEFYGESDGQWYWDNAYPAPESPLDVQYYETKPDTWSGGQVSGAEEFLSVLEKILAGDSDEMEEPEKPWKWKAFKWMMRVHWSQGQLDQVVGTLERCLEVVAQDQDTKHAVKSKLAPLMQSLAKIDGGEADSLYAAVLELVQPQTVDVKTWFTLQLDRATLLVDTRQDAADEASRHSLLEKIEQLLDCTDVELSSQTYSIYNPIRMQSFTIRSEAILWLAGATRWLQHLNAPAVPVFTNDDGSTTASLSDLTEEQLSFSLLNGRSDAMLRFVLGCQLCESEGSLQKQMGYFTKATQNTLASKQLRRAAFEHLLMVQILMALEDPKIAVIDVMGVKDIPPIEWFPDPTVTGIIRKLQLAAGAADVYSFSKLEALLQANINWQEPSRALLRKPFMKARGEICTRLTPSGADYPYNKSYGTYDQAKLWRLERLSAILLSPKHCTDRVDNNSSVGDIEDAMPESQLNDLLDAAVPDLDKMLFYGSSGGQPGLIRGFVTGTYKQGFPNYKNNSDLNEQYIKMMRFIMRKVRMMSLREQKAILGRLCKAFQDCQAVQSRMVQSTYDALLGRNLQRQVLALVDRLKVDETGVLRRVTYELHGTNHGAALPHKEAGIVAEIGTEFGLPGTTSALNDPHKQACGNKAQHIACFRKLFLIDELADWLAQDINSWGENMSENLELYIETANPDNPPGALVKYIQELATQPGDGAAATRARQFANSCYYDEDHPELYSSSPNEMQQECDQPFMHVDAAIQMLEYLFIPQALIYMDAFELEPIGASSEK